VSKLRQIFNARRPESRIGPFLTTLRRDAVFTSGFVDDVTFAHHGQERATRESAYTQGESPGGSAVSAPCRVVILTARDGAQYRTGGEV